jgi:glycosyltransferase involved in cell wall biosynthesis
MVLGGVGFQLERFPPLDRLESRGRFGLPEHGFVILFLGRKTEYKGLDRLVEAFSALRRSRPDVYLLAVGPETDFSRQLWSRYGSLDGLVVRGVVSEDERLAALAACDVLAMPSTGESFGMVYLEAWAYGKPVIGANIASVASLIDHGGDGYLVEPGQVAPLVARLGHLADHLELAEAMGARGRAKLERRYSIECIATIVEGTYARVLRHCRTFGGRGGLCCASA